MKGRDAALAGLGILGLTAIAVAMAKPQQPPPPDGTYYADGFENTEYTKANLRPALGSVWSPNAGGKGVWTIAEDPSDPSNHVLKVENQGGYRAHMAVNPHGSLQWGPGYIFDFDVMFWNPEREWLEHHDMGGPTLFTHFYKQSDPSGSIAESRASFIDPRDNVYGMEKSWGSGRYNYWGSPLWSVGKSDMWFGYAGPSHLDRWYRITFLAGGVHYKTWIGKGKRSTDMLQIFDKLDLERVVYETFPYGYMIFGGEVGTLIDGLTVSKIPLNQVEVAPPTPWNPPMLFHDDFSDPIKTLGYGGSAGYDPRVVYVSSGEMHLKTYVTPEGMSPRRDHDGSWAWRWSKWENYRITLRMKLMNHGVGDYGYANGCQITHVQNPECEYALWIGGHTDGELGECRLQPLGMQGGQYPHQSYIRYNLGWGVLHDHVIEVTRRDVNGNLDRNGLYLGTKYYVDSPSNVIFDYTNKENLCGETRIYGGGLAVKSGYYIHPGHVVLGDVKIEQI